MTDLLKPVVRRGFVLVDNSAPLNRAMWDLMWKNNKFMQWLALEIEIEKDLARWEDDGGAVELDT